MLTMISRLFINATILISFITYGNLFLREKDFKRLSLFSKNYFIGFLSGILGCILMLYSVPITSQVFLDFRYIPIVLSALYLSPLAAIITSLVIGIFRVMYFGLTQSSLAGFFSSLIVGLGCTLIGRTTLKSGIKWICCNVTVDMVVGVTFAYLLGVSTMLYHILFIYYVGIALLSGMMFYFTKFMDTSNQNYRKITEVCNTDFLTGLYNVRQFDTLSSQILHRAQTAQLAVSLLFIDIDFFKKVNDTYGHLEGDLILRELSKILTAACRNKDVVSRNGGEEFSVLLPDCPLDQAVEVAERIRRNVELHEFILSSGQKITITISVGVASFPQTTDNTENLLEHADIALYHAKRAGRNRVMVAGQEKTT